ncbi:MAG: yjbJ [Nitrospira sp.]|jgi:uncharacterized protein YjbJ (UPF0337 family)|nr:yjbJ [Nitrospira sp.]
MKLKSRLLSIITLTGIVFSGGLVDAGSRTAAGLDAPGQDGAMISVVNQDQVAGRWKQFKGELKKKWGEFTDDDLLAIEGSVDKLEGKIQERYGDRREEVKQWVDEWFDANKGPKEASES